eukprot:SAG31_NODE_2624_length_5360_cov_2.184946_1_plen_160_part_10
MPVVGGDVAQQPSAAGGSAGVFRQWLQRDLGLTSVQFGSALEVCEQNEISTIDDLHALSKIGMLQGVGFSKPTLAKILVYLGQGMPPPPPSPRSGQPHDGPASEPSGEGAPTQVFARPTAEPAFDAQDSGVDSFKRFKRLSEIENFSDIVYDGRNYLASG